MVSQYKVDIWSYISNYDGLSQTVGSNKSCSCGSLPIREIINLIITRGSALVFF